MMDDFGNLRRVQPTKPVEKLSRNQILGASSGWVAVVLNILPGLGAGYIYQRRRQLQHCLSGRHIGLQVLFLLFGCLLV